MAMNWHASSSAARAAAGLDHLTDVHHPGAIQQGAEQQAQRTQEACAY
jgi:hypothetical protein